MVIVLIVDDSKVARLALRRGLESDPEIRVVGEAESGDSAESMIRRLKPDLVTMDVYLEGHDGIDVAASIMRTNPLPILIVTGADAGTVVFRAMEAGALDVWPKLPAPDSADYEAARSRMTRAVRSLANVPVVTRVNRLRKASKPGDDKAASKESEEPGIQAILIGASTGGPPVLRQMLEGLPAPFPIPIVIVQHVAKGFAVLLARWLSNVTGHDVEVCEQAETLKPGRVYVAPDERHLRFRSRTSLAPFSGAARAHHRPSIDELFESAAHHLGGSCVAVLLTGMGRDGAAGMAELRRVGAFTLAQLPESCVVESMPKSAMNLDAVCSVVAPQALASALVRAVSSERQSSNTNSTMARQ